MSSPLSSLRRWWFMGREPRRAVWWIGKGLHGYGFSFNEGACAARFNIVVSAMIYPGPAFRFIFNKRRRNKEDPDGNGDLGNGDLDINYACLWSFYLAVCINGAWLNTSAHSEVKRGTPTP